MPAVVHAVTVFGMQPVVPPQVLGTPPPPQVCGGVQVPHVTRPPQPSAIGPHDPTPPLGKSLHCFGVHLVLPPQTLALPPPPQVSGAVHVPHWRRPPHPSPTGPQVVPALAQVRGVQEVLG
jgi:hypothetical protein